MNNKIIAIVNQKGGTGKTTTTINLGSGLSKIGKSVLLIDLDPQANLTYSLGLSTESPTIADVFTGEASLNDIIIQKEGLFIAPGSKDLADIDISLVNQENREKFLKNSIKNSKGYDFIIIDAAPSLSLLTLNALAAASGVIIPLQLEVLALQGLSQILDTINKIKTTINPPLMIQGIVLTMVDGRRNLSQELIDHLQDNFEEYIFRSRIRLNVKVAEAPSFGKSVIAYAPKSAGAKDYLSLAEEYLKRIN